MDIAIILNYVGFLVPPWSTKRKRPRHYPVFQGVSSGHQPDSLLPGYGFTECVCSVASALAFALAKFPECTTGRYESGHSTHRVCLSAVSSTVIVLKGSIATVDCVKSKGVCLFFLTVYASIDVSSTVTLLKGPWQ